ncbi:hypothetical protein [uncultured Kordia sp.]|uniref:hypothetical protein n=1 Tax=uncultured Kordia sp. TaxID=507699 RepID=UPI0026394C40|nr:hypothetical protein [uncultured Kordia sp.]
MNSPHIFSQSIINAKETTQRGNLHFQQSKGKWSFDIYAVWNKRINRLTIKARNVDSVKHFPNCKLFRDPFLTLVSYTKYGRTEAYTFKGKKSIFSETILKSKTTVPLMETKRPFIELRDFFVIFSGTIRSKDHKSLSNIFVLIDFLLDEMDQVIANNSTNH